MTILGIDVVGFVTDYGRALVWYGERLGGGSEFDLE